MRVPSLDTLRDAARSVAAAAGYDLVAESGSVARGDAGAHDVDIGITSHYGIYTSLMRAAAGGAVRV